MSSDELFKHQSNGEVHKAVAEQENQTAADATGKAAAAAEDQDKSISSLRSEPDDQKLHSRVQIPKEIQVLFCHISCFCFI